MSLTNMQKRLLKVQVGFLRDNWPNDGAVGETVHAVCDGIESLLRENAVLQQRLQQLTQAEEAK